jgi:ABC-type histidine transport system ATPase subunit
MRRADYYLEVVGLADKRQEYPALRRAEAAGRDARAFCMEPSAAVRRANLGA